LTKWNSQIRQLKSKMLAKCQKIEVFDILLALCPLLFFPWLLYNDVIFRLNIFIYCNYLPFIIVLIPEYIRKIMYYCAILMCTQFWCSHTSFYVYIEHVLLFTDIDCTWLKYRKVIFIRPRGYQIFIPLYTLVQCNASTHNWLIHCVFIIHLYI
jgi:hypothetical protein